MIEEGYKIKGHTEPVKRYCQTMDLKNNPSLIAKYKKCHNRAESWPEIRAGIRSVGILEMEIYILGSRLFMIVETPLDFNWKTIPSATAGRVGKLCSRISRMQSGKYFC